MTAHDEAKILGLDEKAIAAFSGTAAEFANYFGVSISEGEGAVVAPTVEITGVTAGAPGTFAPSGFTPLSNFGALEANGAVGNTGTNKPGAAWTTGQYVVLGDASEASWDGAKWVVGRAA